MTLKIEPTFWLTAVLMATAYGGSSAVSVVFWIGIIFLSVLAHELGHALAAKALGGRPHIELHGLGGTTSTEAPHTTVWRDVFITLCGPLAGALLALALWRAGYHQAMRLNLFWTAVNLLPIQPLDGGSVLRTLAGPRIGFMAGTAVAGLGAAASLYAHMTITAVSLGLLAASNWRGLSDLSELEAIPDVEVEEFEEAQELLETRPASACRRLMRLMRKSGSRKVREACALQLAGFFQSAGRFKSAFRLMDKLGDDLPREMLGDFQRAAYEVGQHKKALRAGNAAFLAEPDAEVAYYNALACSAMDDDLGSERWFGIAKRHGYRPSAGE